MKIMLSCTLLMLAAGTLGGCVVDDGYRRGPGYERDRYYDHDRDRRGDDDRGRMERRDDRHDDRGR